MNIFIKNKIIRNTKYEVKIILNKLLNEKIIINNERNDKYILNTINNNLYRNLMICINNKNYDLTKIILTKYKYNDYYTLFLNICAVGFTKIIKDIVNVGKINNSIILANGLIFARENLKTIKEIFSLGYNIDPMDYLTVLQYICINHNMDSKTKMNMLSFLFELGKIKDKCILEMCCEYCLPTHNFEIEKFIREYMKTINLTERHD